MTNRLENLRDVIDVIINEKQADLDKYFFSHLYGVSHFCALLAIRRNLDAEIATVCGMLHDIYQVIAGSSENHAVKGAEEARRILNEQGAFNDAEIAIITTAISRHSDKYVVHEPMDEVLKDADVMHHCLYNIDIPATEKERKRYANILMELGCTSNEV